MEFRILGPVEVVERGRVVPLGGSRQRALLALSPKQRAVIVLRYFEDRTEVEAAQLLGISVSTVKTQCARALDRLRTLVPDLRLRADVHEAGR